MTTTITAADVWHADPEHITEGVLRRERIRRDWPELASVLDGSIPSKFLTDEFLTDEEPLTRAIRAIPAPVETVNVRIKMNGAAVIGWLASALVAFSLGMMVQFAILAPAVTR